MINNLTEAIAHAKEVAKEIRKANEEMPTDCKLSEELCECAKEHEQLADWLEELKARREADRWIPVSERLPEERDWYLGIFKEPDTGYIGLPYICDYVGEVTKGTTNEGWILRHCTDVDNAPDYFRNLICVEWRPLPEYKESEGE